MKAFKHLKKNGGSSILEVLIAVAVLTLGISAAAILTFGNQSLKLDSETADEALYKAKTILENARVASRDTDDFEDLQTGVPIADSIYQKQLVVDPFEATECSKQIEAKIIWSAEIPRPQTINLLSRVTNMEKAAEMGGDCSALPPGPGFIVGGSLNIGGDKTNGLDVFNKKIFIALQNSPGLAYVDATIYTTPVQITNGYDVGSEVNAVDVAKDPDTGKIYAYVARQTATDQLQIIDVTNISSPQFIRNIDLPEVTGGSQPYAYRIYYYKNVLYVLTRETAGPELHIFDASDPANPLPKYGTKELNRTVNDIVVIDQNIAGTDYTVAYMSADSNAKEIGVFDVTSPSSANEMFSLNMSGNADAYSVFYSALSKLLYVGRQVNSAEEFYAFDASNSFTTLVEKAKVEVGENPIGLRVVGKYAYMVTNDSNEDFQTYNADPLTGLSYIRTYNASNKGTGIDYEEQFVYETMEQGSAVLQIYYVP